MTWTTFEILVIMARAESASSVRVNEAQNLARQLTRLCL
jgi:hypothetical protein